MGWFSELSPCMADVTLEYRKDVQRVPNGPSDGTAQSLLEPVELSAHIEPMAPEWNARNGFPEDRQMLKVMTDDFAGLFDTIVAGDVIVWRGRRLVASARATVSPATDFPLAELLVRDETGMGRRS